MQGGALGYRIADLDGECVDHKRYFQPEETVTDAELAVDASKRRVRTPTAATDLSTFHDSEHAAHPSSHNLAGGVVARHGTTLMNNRSLQAWWADQTSSIQATSITQVGACSGR